MQDTVPVSSIVCMAVSCLLGFMIPIGLLVYLLKKKKADLIPFLTGLSVMLIFALILESVVHTVVFKTAFGETIYRTPWMYALYGGLMAGLFEETGRLTAYRTVLRKYMGRNINAVMYGAGHGGLEAAVILGMTMINNLIWSFMINSGRIEALTGAYTGEVLEQIQASIRGLVTTPSWHYLLAGLERILAVILQIVLSVLVWFAVKNKKRGYLFPAAILIHMAVDAGAVLLMQTGIPLPAVEAAIALMTLAAALFARSIYRSEEAAGRSE